MWLRATRLPRPPTDTAPKNAVVYVIADRQSVHAATRESAATADTAEHPDPPAPTDDPADTATDPRGGDHAAGASDDAGVPTPARDTAGASPRCAAPPAYVLGAGVLPSALLGGILQRARLREVHHPGDTPPEPRYTPTPALCEFVRCRDLTCRFPGCDKPAQVCDIDHTVPYPVGPTHPSNLKCLCRFHDLLKRLRGPRGLGYSSHWTIEEAAMAGIPAFRSDDARAAYCQLYDAAVAASTLPVTESDVETSFGRTHVLAAGDPSKPPLVAMHGMQLGATSWLPLLPGLAEAHRVTMIDVAGQVSKSIATKPITKAAHIVAWLDETLRALRIERAAMVGLSFGSWIATHYAMAFPDRVDRLALIGPIGLVSGIHLRVLPRFSEMGIRPSQARLELFLEACVTPAGRERLRQDPWQLIMQQFVVGMMGFKFPLIGNLRPTRCDLRPLCAVRIPVLVIIGRDEWLHDGPKMAARFRQRLPEARIEIVDDANHIIPVDQPEIVETLLADFLH